MYVFYSFLTKKSNHKLQKWKPVFILYSDFLGVLFQNDNSNLDIS